MAAKKKAGAKKKAATKKTAARTPAKAAKRPVAKKATKVARVTLASLSEQIAALAASLDAMRARLDGHFPVAVASPPPVPPLDYASFETDLLSTLADLDRRGRHAGLVPIPDLRIAFLDRGWTRDVFDECLLQAERDFVVDLKTADDPATLANPDLAIHEAGRGHLQYVVAR